MNCSYKIAYGKYRQHWQFRNIPRKILLLSAGRNNCWLLTGIEPASSFYWQMLFPLSYKNLKTYVPDLFIYNECLECHWVYISLSSKREQLFHKKLKGNFRFLIYDEVWILQGDFEIMAFLGIACILITTAFVFCIHMLSSELMLFSIQRNLFPNHQIRYIVLWFDCFGLNFYFEWTCNRFRLNRYSILIALCNTK